MKANNLKNQIFLYLKKYPPSLKLFQQLEQAGDIYLIGGILREYRDRQEIKDLRDIDIIIDVKNGNDWIEILEQYQPEINSFGGYKLECSGLIVDIWKLQETWAYREGYVLCKPEEYVQNLQNTVFLNTDAIIYDLIRNIWYDEKYIDAMKSGIIDVILEENPQILLNIVRSLVLKKRYAMSFSEKLKAIIRSKINSDTELTEKLLQIQLSRYKKIILSKKEIEIELNQI